ncbi:hypothetical protein [Timonella sp. A28]|uniref:hypothetical protein n=1 Tax=Timonella sp. A28 TaxID=3442640 RepID=UPI003EB90C8C
MSTPVLEHSTVPDERGTPITEKFMNWCFPALPLARIAVFRVIIYSFVIWDIFNLTNDVVGHSYAPEFYDPTWIGRNLPFPNPDPTLALIMQWALVASCVIAASGFLPRIAGWSVAILFLAWMENSQGFSYVSHDHMALIVATWVLPTVGRAKFLDTRKSQAAGWALRVVQVSTVFTYFGSVFSKIASNGSFWAWPNSAVFTWAFMRRGSDFITWTLEYPPLLKAAQWGLYIIEIISPVVFWLRGRWQYAFIFLFFIFHLATFLALGIHFLPTVVCWLAFFPLEMIPRGMHALATKLKK